MNLIRRTSGPLGLSTFEEMDKIMNSLMSGLPTLASSNLPAVDIYSEDDEHMVVEMPAPGFDDNDIEVHVRDGVLEIRGERHSKEEQRDKQRSYMVRESTSSFARRIALPDGANSDSISAELDKGLLRVVVPVERAEAKKIKVSGGKSGKAKQLDTK